jgi:hypothetical protein
MRPPDDQGHGALRAVTMSAGMSNRSVPSLATKGRSAILASSRRRANCSSSSTPPSVQTAGPLGRDQVGNRPEADGSIVLPDLRIRHAGLVADGEQPLRVAEHEGRPHGVPDPAAEQPVEERCKRRIAGRALNRVADGHGHPAAGAQHSHHLAHRRRRVVEEHEAELADHGIEAPIRQRQRLRLPLQPLDRRRLAPCHRQHLRVGVEADHRSFGPYAAAASDDLLDRLIALTLAEARTSRPGGDCIACGSAS